jgi:hypothetical protein
MTTATREALEQVSRILHDAGWDAPPADPDVTDAELQALRSAYSDLRDEHFTLLRQTLGQSQRVEDAGRSLGLAPEQARLLFHEAITRLRALATAGTRVA